MDYWHYLCDVCEPHNGSFIYIPRKVESNKTTRQDTIDMFKSMLDNELKRRFPNKRHVKDLEELIAREEEHINNPKVDPWDGWEQKITDLIFQEFGEYAEDDYLEVWVEW
jgi:hypothetical protein